jgi:formylglycine-generating enzyme required for sulfatase activity
MKDQPSRVDAAAPTGSSSGGGGTDAAASTGSSSGEADAGLCRHPLVSEECEKGMCRIPPGCFTMGAPRDEVFVGAVADVQVQVRLTRGFWIGQTELTLADWRRVGFQDPIPDWVRTGSKDPATPPAGYSTCSDPNCPVVWLNYEDAMAYANARSEAEGLKPCYELTDCVGAPGRFLRCKHVKTTASDPYSCEGYRLPTEAEWEYAARAGTKTAFYSGDIAPDVEAAQLCERLDPNLDRIGWYCVNVSAEQPNLSAQPVKGKEPNKWGLYDTAGNAREWVNDLYDPRGYGKGVLEDPLFGTPDRADLTPPLHSHYEDTYFGPDGYPAFRSTRGGVFDAWSYMAKASWRGYIGIGAQHSGVRLVRSDL